MYVYVYVCMYAWVYVCMCVCMYYVSLSVFIENVTSAIVYVTGIDYSRSKME